MKTTTKKLNLSAAKSLPVCPVKSVGVLGESLGLDASKKEPL